MQDCTDSIKFKLTHMVEYKTLYIIHTILLNKQYLIYIILYNSDSSDSQLSADVLSYRIVYTEIKVAYHPLLPLLREYDRYYKKLSLDFNCTMIFSKGEFPCSHSATIRHENKPDNFGLGKYI